MEKNKRMKVKLSGIIIFLLIMLILIGGFVLYRITSNKKLHINGEVVEGKIDDWQYSGQSSFDDIKGSSISQGSLTTTQSIYSTASDSMSTLNSTVGLSTGGAKDVNNFRENIKNNYFPISTDITYNGMFYDYVFDTGKKNESTELFSPAYSTAISKDPISDKNEYYMTVGLNSNIKESDFSRKKLNLVVVLDISGSMSSNFNSYYYDDPWQARKEDEDTTKTKMQIANESVNILIDQLKKDDKFGMVLFDDGAYLGKPISLISETDVSAIKNHILEIQPKRRN